MTLLKTQFCRCHIRRDSFYVVNLKGSVQATREWEETLFWFQASLKDKLEPHPKAHGHKKFVPCEVLDVRDKTVESIWPMFLLIHEFFQYELTNDYLDEFILNRSTNSGTECIIRLRVAVQEIKPRICIQEISLHVLRLLVGQRPPEVEW